MPESSDPPASENLSDPVPAARPAVPPAKESARVPIAPRSKPPSINNTPQAQPPPPALGPTINLSDLVQLAQNYSGPPTQQPPVNRALIPKEQKKFSRRENKPREEFAEGIAPETSGVTSSAGLSHEHSAAAPANSTARQESVSPNSVARSNPSAAVAKKRPPSVPLTANRHAHRGGKFPLAAFFIGQTAIILLVFLGWLAWRAAQPVKSAPMAGPSSYLAPESGGEVTIADSTFDFINRMMTAEKAGDFSKALALCERIRTVDKRIPHLDYKQAQLAMMVGDSNQAMLALSRAADSGEDLSEGHILRASLLIQQGKMAPAAREYELAAQTAPFTAKPFFYWGECLRRLGKPQAALVHLDQALQRAREPGEEALYQLKKRLTLIELNREQEFADTLKAEVTRTPPAPEWLLTAAAQELHRGNFTAAASYLDQTAKLIPPESMSVWLRDYFLFSFAQQKELERFYGPLLAALAPPKTSQSSSPAPPAVQRNGETPLNAVPSSSSGQDAISLGAPADLPGAPASSPLPPPRGSK